MAGLPGHKEGQAAGQYSGDWRIRKKATLAQHSAGRTEAEAPSSSPLRDIYASCIEAGQAEVQKCTERIRRPGPASRKGSESQTEASSLNLAIPPTGGTLNPKRGGRGPGPGTRTRAFRVHLPASETQMALRFRDLGHFMLSKMV